MATITFRRSVLIRRPVEEVFNVLATERAQNRARWMKEIIEIEKTSKGSVGIGTTWREVTEDERGKRTETILTVTDFEPNRRLAIDGISRFTEDQPHARTHIKDPSATTRQRSTTTFEPVASGTRVSFITDLEYSDSNMGYASKLFMSIYVGRQKERYGERIDMVRDLIEADAGLPVRKQRFKLRRVGFGWIVFALVFVLVFWAHGARYELHMSQFWVQATQIILVAMAVIGVIGIYLTAAYQRR